MPYVTRHKDGSINAISNSADSRFSEYIDDTSPEVSQFIASYSSSQTEAESALQASDHAFARVTEDLIQLLVEKNTIMFTELPEVVQEKLLNRERLRSKLRGATSKGLLDDEGGI